MSLVNGGTASCCFSPEPHATFGARALKLVTCLCGRNFTTLVMAPIKDCTPCLRAAEALKAERANPRLIPGPRSAEEKATWKSIGRPILKDSPNAAANMRRRERCAFLRAEKALSLRVVTQ